MVVEAIEVEEPPLEVRLRLVHRLVGFWLLPRIANCAVIPVSFPLLHAQPAELVLAVSADDTAGTASQHTWTYWADTHSLASSGLLNAILTLGARPRVRLDPLRRARIVARVLDPLGHHPADQRAVVRVEAAAKAERVALPAVDDGHLGEQRVAAAACREDRLGAAGVRTEAEVCVGPDVGLHE